MKRALVLLVLGTLMVAVPSSAGAEIIGLGSISETTVGFQENGFYSGTQYDITGYSAPSSVVLVGSSPATQMSLAASQCWYFTFPVWNGSGAIEFDFWAQTSAGTWFGTRISWSGVLNFTNLGSWNGPEPPGPSPVPEPASLLLFGTGLIGLAGVARRRRKQ